CAVAAGREPPPPAMGVLDLCPPNLGAGAGGLPAGVLHGAAVQRRGAQPDGAAAALLVHRAVPAGPAERRAGPAERLVRDRPAARGGARRAALARAARAARPARVPRAGPAAHLVA